MSSLLLLLVAQLCRPFETSWTAAHQAFLSFSVSQSLLRLMSIELMMPSNHPILCCPLLLLPSVFPSIRVFFFPNKSVLCIRWPKLEVQLQQQSLKWIFRVDFLLSWLVWFPCRPKWRQIPVPRWKHMQEGEREAAFTLCGDEGNGPLPSPVGQGY